MQIKFDSKAYKEHNITPEIIKDEVEMVGFGAELLEVIETSLPVLH
jgi:hypothetical protein